MATQLTALFMIHPDRSKEAFDELIKEWAGILISDGYGVYQKWLNARQKGERWVERILSLRQTCRLSGRKTCPVLIDALNSYFKEQLPDLTWIG